MDTIYDHMKFRHNRQKNLSEINYKKRAGPILNFQSRFTHTHKEIQQQGFPIINYYIFYRFEIVRDKL